MKTIRINRKREVLPPTATNSVPQSTDFQPLSTKVLPNLLEKDDALPSFEALKETPLNNNFENLLKRKPEGMTLNVSGQ